MRGNFRDGRCSPAMRSVHRVYDIVSDLLLGVSVVMAFGALVLLLRAPQMRARIERQTAVEIQAENETFCKNRGLTPGTHAFTICELDLGGIRANEDNRLMRSAF